MLDKAKLNTLRAEVARYFRILGKQTIRPVFPGGQGSVAIEASLKARVFRKDGTVEDLGIISTKVVTDAFVQYLVDGMQSSSTDVSLFQYHDCGTGNTAESASDTALVTPYGGSRTAGSQTEGASANIYKSVGTINFTSTLAIVEHGLFSAASAGTLCDRSVFSAINVVNGDAIEFTYELTFPSGS